MKRKMTFIAMCLGAWLAVSSFGQWTAGHEYQPFLKEGKTWLVQYSEKLVQDQRVPNDSCLYYLQGDTVIDGTVYMKAYCQYLGEAPTYYAALREADRKVYMILYYNYDGNLERTDEFMLYDFDSKVGDRYQTSTNLNHPALSSVRVEDIKGVAIRNKDYLYQKIQNIQIITWQSIFYDVYECIGSTNGPFSFLTNCTLLSCYDGETCLYEKGDEIKDLEGIRSINNEELKMNNEMFDLQGKRITEPQKGSIYIQKGKKIKK